MAEKLAAASLGGPVALIGAAALALGIWAAYRQPQGSTGGGGSGSGGSKTLPPAGTYVTAEGINSTYKIDAQGYKEWVAADVYASCGSPSVMRIDTALLVDTPLGPNAGYCQGSPGGGAAGGGSTGGGGTGCDSCPWWSPCVGGRCVSGGNTGGGSGGGGNTGQGLHACPANLDLGSQWILQLQTGCCVPCTSRFLWGKLPLGCDEKCPGSV
jgi:hypothetical protein